MNGKETMRAVTHPREYVRSRLQRKYIGDPLEVKARINAEYSHDFRNVPELRDLRDDQFPDTVAITPDGQRRAAEKMGVSLEEGYQMGADTLFEVLDVTVDPKVPIKSAIAWLFSSDNWNRKDDEVALLMKLFHKDFNKIRERILTNDARFIQLGNPELREGKALQFPEYAVVLSEIHELEEKTKDNKGKTIAMGFDYGGEDQDVRSHNRAYYMGYWEGYGDGADQQEGEARNLTPEDMWKLRDGQGIVRSASLGFRTGEDALVSDGSYYMHISDIGWVNGKPTGWMVFKKEFPFLTLQDIAIGICAYAGKPIRQGK